MAKPKHAEKEALRASNDRERQESKHLKRHGNLFEKIYDMDNLEAALHNASKGKHWQRKVRKVEAERESYLAELQYMLKSHSFTTSGYKTKYIYEPKKRLISVLPFYPDRIVQHAIMLVMEPIWDRMMIYDSYACRKGKGQHKASNRCREHAIRYEYCMQFDISKFYPSIPHKQLKEVIRRKVKDKELLWLLDDIIDSADGDVGVPIGNYVSQWFGNLYLDRLDTYVKQELGVSAYLRYCDDFLVFSDDKEWLKHIGDAVERFCKEKLLLRLSRKNLFHTWQGIDFVGYRHFRSGKVLVRKRTAKRIMRKLKSLGKHIEKCNREKARSVVASAKGWLIHANTYNMRESMELWKLEGMLTA